MAKKDDVITTEEQVTTEEEAKTEEIQDDENKTLTYEEHQEALNKTISQRLKDEKAKHSKELAELQKKMQEQIKEERKEAEELAKLSAEERSKVEKEKETLRIDKERKELEDDKRIFQREKLLLETEKQLAARKLPVEFAKYVIGDSAESTLESITVFEEQWQEALDTGIRDRLKGPSPQQGQQVAGNKRFTSEMVDKMSQSEVNANLGAIKESMKTWS